MTDTRDLFERTFALCDRQKWRTWDCSGYKDASIQAKWEGWQRALETVPNTQREDAEADHYTITRMGELLASIAIALKGPEEAMKRHGYQDLVELVQAKVFEVEILKQQLATPAPTAPIGHIVTKQGRGPRKSHFRFSETFVPEIGEMPIYATAPAPTAPSDAPARPMLTVELEKLIVAQAARIDELMAELREARDD